MSTLTEWYESGNAPHEALGRAARKLRGGGALYLGGGVGVEAQQTAQGATKYSLTGGGKTETFGGPLSAVIRAFAAAGASTSPDTPGGATAVTDPAAAARLRELADEESSAKQDIERYQRQLTAKAARPWTPAGQDDWETRRIDELRANLKSIAAERSKLLAAGKVEEVEQARPGTNFTKIPAENVKKLQPIIDHYKGMARPFTTCVRDQIKHGLSEDHANRRCAVVKDLGQGTTKWRKGSKVAEDALAAALGRVAAIEETLGVGSSVGLVEADVASLPPLAAAFAEGMAHDLALLAVAEHPLGLLVYPLAEFATPKVTETKRAGGRTFSEAAHPRDPHGMFTEKIGGLAKGAAVELHGVKVTHVGTALAGYRIENKREALGKAGAYFTATPKEAARVAVGRSLASKDPKSLGGAKSYSSIMDLPGNEGVAPKMKLPGSGGAQPSGELADLRQQLARVNATLKSGKGPQAYAKKRKAEIEQQLAKLKEGARGEGVGMLVEAFSQSAPIQTPAKQDAQRAVGKKAGTKKASGSTGTGGTKYDESKHKRASAGQTGGGRFVASGSSGEDVRAVQHRVGATPDGKFGAKTKRAVMEFQKAHGLQVDGVVGKQTAAALAGDFRGARENGVGALDATAKKRLKRLRKGGASLRGRGRRKPKAAMASRGRGGAIV